MGSLHVVEATVDMNRILNREPGKLRAGLLALAVHALFVVFLVVGVTWRAERPAPVQVDLWRELPPMPSSPKPEAKPERAPEPPKPVVKPAPEPKAEPKAAPKPEKPDIALKEKLEKERLSKEAEAKRQEELKKQRELEQKKKEDARRQAEERRKLLDEQVQREKELLAQAQARRAQQEAQNRAEAQRLSALSRLRDEYMFKIKDKIKRNLVMPSNLQGNPEAHFDVRLTPGGQLVTVTLVKSSGVPAYDDAVERAIKKSDPLPMPPDPVLIHEFRSLRLVFRPDES